MDECDSHYDHEIGDEVYNDILEVDAILKCNKEIRIALASLPSAQPERKKGEWIDKSGGVEGAWNYCSVCGEQAIDLYDFCPNCGADMRGTWNETN